MASDRQHRLSPIAEEMPGDLILSEIASLPEEQHLVAYKQYDGYGFQSQVPNVVKIARLRK